MDPQVETLVIAGLATGMVLLAIGVCLPTFLASIGMAFFDCGGDPEDEVAQTETDEHYLDLRKQLLELGFTSVGWGWERAITLPRGSRTSLFTNAEHGCYAGLWRLSGGDYRAYMTTVFIDGAAVMTANYSRPETHTSDYHAAGKPTRSMDVLLAEHRAAVADFVKRGHDVQPCTTLDDVLEAKRTYFYNPSVQVTYCEANFKVFVHRFKEMVVYPGILVALLLYFNKGRLLAWGTGFFASAFLGVIVRGYEFKNLKAAHLREKTYEQRLEDRRRARKQRPWL